MFSLQLFSRQLGHRNFCAWIDYAPRVARSLAPDVGYAAASTLPCWLLYEARNLSVPKHIFARIIGMSPSRVSWAQLQLLATCPMLDLAPIDGNFEILRRPFASITEATLSFNLSDPCSSAHRTWGQFKIGQAAWLFRTLRHQWWHEIDAQVGLYRIMLFSASGCAFFCGRFFPG